jgi:betaine reductase
MDLENQAAIKRLADEVGADKLVVVLGATEMQGLELAASTLTEGDPSYAGVLAGVSLRLPVYHILESAVRGSLPAEVGERHLGMAVMVADVGQIEAAMPRLRAAVGAPSA